MEELKQEIENFSKEEKTEFFNEVVPSLCKELLGDEACREKVKEIFGIDCIKELEKRFEAAI